MGNSRYHEKELPVPPIRERMEMKATEVARALGLCHKYAGKVKGTQTFGRKFDATRREWFEWGRFEFDYGWITVDSRTMDVEVQQNMLPREGEKEKTC